MASADRRPTSSHEDQALPRGDAFRFVDLFAGIGGIRAGFGTEADSVFTWSGPTRRTLEDQLGRGRCESDIRDVLSSALPEHEILAAGFPCQPFSLAGVSKKQSLGRAHGFDDPASGNLFFEIVRLIGGPWQLSAHELQDEAEAPDREDNRFQGTHAPGTQSSRSCFSRTSGTFSRMTGNVPIG